MDRFFAQGGQFYLNDRPQFIQAGEFHYFRTPEDQWENRLRLLLAAGFNAVACYIPWRWHQLDEDVSDFDGHTHPMRNLAGFLDLAAGMGLYILVRPGPYIMAETTREGIPDWVFEKYPQVAFVSQDGQRQDVVSYLHPDFLACVRKWYRAVLAILVPRQITRGGKILMAQIDNEMGMVPWVRNMVDTNPDTIARLAAYLRSTYGDQLAARYPADHLEEFLGRVLADPQNPFALPVLEDYRRFYRGYLREYASFLWTEAKADGMDVPAVINIHGFMNGGKTFPIGLSQLAEVMRAPGVISATDVYPGHIDEGNFHQLLLANEMTKTLQNVEQPLFSIEFQAGGNPDFGGGQTSFYDLHTRLCISSGMRAINHYLFFDGENDPLLSPVKRHEWGHPVRKDGSLRRHYARYGKVSSVLKSYGTDLILSKPEVVTTIGFQLDDFMTEVNNAASQEATRIITHQREQILFDFIARGLALTHRPFDALELSRGSLNVAQTPLLWAMMERQCDAATQQKLVDYVREGGKLVLVGRVCLEEFNHKPCTILKDALGITEAYGAAPFSEASIRAFEHRDVPATFVETYRGDFDEVFATSKSGETVGFVKTIGAGQVLMFGAAVPTDTLDDLDIVEEIATKMGCQPLFRLSDWADIRLSRSDKAAFVFINNYQDDPVKTTVECAGRPLFGGNPVSLPARSGLILPLDWQPAPGVLVHYATSEITGVEANRQSLTLSTAQPAFDAELSLQGYRCPQAQPSRLADGSQRWSVHGQDGQIVLVKG
jgi:beta-galactosidase